MNDRRQDMCIGVDGGGTSCRLALLRNGQRTESHAGSANVTSDFEGAVRRLTDGLRTLGATAGLTPEEMARIPAYLGLAGAGDDALVRKVATALPLEIVKIEEDHPATLAGAFGSENGAVAGIGTGSFIARQANGVAQKIGGHGFLLGDEASGAWLGRSLLTAVLHAADGLGPSSALTDEVSGEFNTAPAKIAAFAAGAAPGDFGRYAPRVVAAAAADDAVALRLMQSGARYIQDGLAAVGWQPGEALCLTGGLAPHYEPYLDPTHRAALRAPLGSALDGALALAGEFAAAHVAEGAT